jgi:bacillithiol synthase
LRAVNRITSGATGERMDLIIRAGPLARGSRIVRDYVAGHAPFYSGHPADVASYRAKASEVERRMDAETRQRVAGAIEPLGDSAARLARILDGDGFFITTGQQPALFGGPLYTLYKVLAAVRLAERLESELAKPVLALFWIGADDHDWDEANHTFALDERDYAQRITVHAAADVPALPLNVRTWGPGVGTAVDALIALLPHTPTAAMIAAHVRADYQPNATVESSFTETMRLLLRDRRVAMVSSAHPLVRRAAVPVLQREIERSPAHADLLATRVAALSAAGYEAQVEITRDAANLMLIDDEGRDRLAMTRTGWRTRRLGRTLSERELLDSIETDPMRFSPNVLLRPVVENTIFPTIGYMAGPGEVAYFAQIGPLFEAHGVMPPVVVPRPSVLLIEPEVNRLLARLGMEHDAFNRPFDALASDVMRRWMPASARASLDALRASMLAGFGDVATAGDDIDPTLRGTITASRNAVLLRLQETEKKIVTRMKRRSTETMEQLRRVATGIYPESAPQERIFGPLPYLARYGTGFVAAVESALP